MGYCTTTPVFQFPIWVRYKEMWSFKANVPGSSADGKVSIPYMGKVQVVMKSVDEVEEVLDMFQFPIWVRYNNISL